MVVTETAELPADPRVAQYPISEAEAGSEAIVAAFEQLGARGIDEGSVLYDWIEPDALDQLFRHSQGNPHVDMELWGRPVRISRETVTIYEPN
jgi:hypothetical protein